MNVAIKGISRRHRETYYNALEVCDDCFEALHKRIERGEAIAPADVDAAITDTDFSVFVEMLCRSLEETISRLQGPELGRAGNDDVIPLRALAQHFDYSQDYLRNLINRGHLKARKRGKLWYVRVGDMHQYLQGRGRSSD